MRYECGRELVEESDQYRGLLSSFTVYIMPSMNPDGYEYTRSRDRWLHI